MTAHSLVLDFAQEMNLSPLKPTDELSNKLNRAKEKHQLASYIDDLDHAAESRNAFADYYFNLPAVKRLRMKDLHDGANIDRTYLEHIKGKTRRPGRDKVLALCFAAGLPLEEVNRCLKLAEVAPLYPRSRRDAVIIYAIGQELTLEKTNALLDEFEQAPIN